MAGYETPGLPSVVPSGIEGFAVDTNLTVGAAPQVGKMTTNQIGPSNNFRNLLDGGDFTTNPFQRGTSTTGITNTVTYTADRWFAVGGASSSISVSQQAITAGLYPGFGYALQWGRASANANTATIYLGQVMETLDSIRLQGQNLVVSFGAIAGANLSSAGGLVTVTAYSGTGANQSAANMIAGSWTNQTTIGKATFAVSQTTWSALTYQFFSLGVVPTTATQVGLVFSYVPVGTAGSNDWVQFVGIQLETGSYPSQFEHRDVQVELEIAQRFCFAPGGTVGALAGGAATSSTAAGFFVNFPVQMRAAPTAAPVTTAADLSVYTYANASVAACSAVAFGSANPTGAHITVTSSGMTTAVPYVLYVATALSGNIVFSADF